MSEPISEPQPIEPAEPQNPADGTDWKAEARKWEARAKENSTAAQRLAEIEEAQKTELQKAIERAEAAEAKAAKFETERQLAGWRSEVAAASGVPAEALRGSTKEELQAHADALKPLIAAPRGPVIPKQGDEPDTSAVSAEREFARGLFGGD